MYHLSELYQANKTKPKFYHDVLKKLDISTEVVNAMVDGSIYALAGTNFSNIYYTLNPDGSIKRAGFLGANGALEHSTMGNEKPKGQFGVKDQKTFYEFLTDTQTKPFLAPLFKRLTRADWRVNAMKRHIDNVQAVLPDMKIDGLSERQQKLLDVVKQRHQNFSKGIFKTIEAEGIMYHDPKGKRAPTKFKVRNEAGTDNPVSDGTFIDDKFLIKQTDLPPEIRDQFMTPQKLRQIFLDHKTPEAHPAPQFQGMTDQRILEFADAYNRQLVAGAIKEN